MSGDVREIDRLLSKGNILDLRELSNEHREALKTIYAIAMETREGGDVKQAPSRSDDSAAIAQKGEL